MNKRGYWILYNAFNHLQYHIQDTRFILIIDSGWMPTVGYTIFTEFWHIPPMAHLHFWSGTVRLLKLPVTTWLKNAHYYEALPQNSSSYSDWLYIIELKNKSKINIWKQYNKQRSDGVYVSLPSSPQNLSHQNLK